MTPAHCYLHHAVHLFFGLRTESLENGNSRGVEQRLLGIRTTKVRQLGVRRLSGATKARNWRAFPARKRKFSKSENGWVTEQDSNFHIPLSNSPFEISRLFGTNSPILGGRDRDHLKAAISPRTTLNMRWLSRCAARYPLPGSKRRVQQQLLTQGGGNLESLIYWRALARNPLSASLSSCHEERSLPRISGGEIQPGSMPVMSGNSCAMPLWQSIQVRSPVTR